MLRLGRISRISLAPARELPDLTVSRAGGLGRGKERFLRLRALAEASGEEDSPGLDCCLSLAHLAAAPPGSQPYPGEALGKMAK